MKVRELIALLNTYDPNEPVANTIWLTQDVAQACEMCELDFSRLTSNDIETILDGVSGHELTDDDWNRMCSTVEEHFNFIDQNS